MNAPTELARSSRPESISAAFWRVLPADLDPVETREWLDGFETLVREGGVDRGTYVLRRLLDQARACQVPLPAVLNTPYTNSITLDRQAQFPGNLEIEARLSAIVRWNALAMVVRANKLSSDLGGHIATYASIADLFEVGFNHFFRAGQDGDPVFFQPHAAPGVYSRALDEQCDEFYYLTVMNENYAQPALPQGVGEYVDARYTTLGTDGFGRSGTRLAVRKFFEVDRFHVAVAALDALAGAGIVDRARVADAIAKYALDAELGAPWLL